ncbi:tetratricopeptide repeat (TPR)-like superfamily protein [Actinidia rufa]|uniref:Tetratricopeptide repeat (TPR)-like superfamily protein n=1 Tax=Actinidia rufa TaxID=165716 RepID=A0A7J0FTJ0_9ERIC|nr:tetratricopeptide repeat (TPR)-like superfamily protein [Actinidia rufa]
MRLFPWPKGLKSILLTCKDRASVSKIHAFMIVSGSNRTCNGQLVAAYGRIGEIELAHKVFDRLPQRGIDASNAIIKDCRVEVIDLYHRMIWTKLSLIARSLKACASLLVMEMGEEIWHRLRAVECGYESDVFVGSSLLNLYVKCGKMDEDMNVLNKMPRRDLVSWTTMVAGLAQSGHANEAINFYRMMRGEELEGDGVVMLGLIQACANLEEIKMGLSVHGSIHGYIVRRLDFERVSGTAVIDSTQNAGRFLVRDAQAKRYNQEPDGFYYVVRRVSDEIFLLFQGSLKLILCLRNMSNCCRASVVESNPQELAGWSKPGT